MEALDDRLILALQWALSEVRLKIDHRNSSLVNEWERHSATLREAEERRASEEEYWEAMAERWTEFNDPFDEQEELCDR